MHIDEYREKIRKQDELLKKVAHECYKAAYNEAIDACLEVWDNIGPNETDLDIANRFKDLKK